MLIPREREKLINAIVYFATNTHYCGTVKLFRLLYLLDFGHFRETGRSVTGLDYRAWQLGPVPFNLFREWDRLQPDLAKVGFDNSHFTKRELRLMAELAARFQDDKTESLINVTHEERGPWDKIWDGGRGDDSRIPYTLAVPDDDPNRDAILEAARDHESMIAADSSRH